MMYLSHLLIDTGSNPDRPRPGRKWLDNIYNVHRRLCMAFPLYKRENDPHFLLPFDPRHYMHAARPFLFRVDNNIDGSEKRAVIIVQSDIPPDWEWCFHNAPDFLVAPPETKHYDPSFAFGQELRFRLRANPSVRRMITDKNTGKVLHKRVAFTWDRDTTPDAALAGWLAAKASKLGFTPLQTELVQLAWVYGSKPEPANVEPKKDGNGFWRENNYRHLRYRSALLEGFLRVDDPALFLQTLAKGIGSGKSMGFGLLTVKMA